MENLWNSFLAEFFSKESLIMLASIVISVILVIVVPAITDVVAGIIRRRRKMKKKILFLLVFIFVFSGCAPMWVKSQTKIVKNEEGKITSSQYTRDITGLSWNDPETAESWAYADQVARQSQANTNGLQAQNFEQHRFLAIRNITNDYVVEIESEPFSGASLAPGEKTREKKAFPVGLYQLKFKWCKIGGTNCANKKINISIDRRRTVPITITEKN